MESNRSLEGASSESDHESYERASHSEPDSHSAHEEEFHSEYESCSPSPIREAMLPESLWSDMLSNLSSRAKDCADWLAGCMSAMHWKWNSRNRNVGVCVPSETSPTSLRLMFEEIYSVTTFMGEQHVKPRQSFQWNHSVAKTCGSCEKMHLQVWLGTCCLEGWLNADWFDCYGGRYRTRVVLDAGELRLDVYSMWDATDGPHGSYQYCQPYEILNSNHVRFARRNSFGGRVEDNGYTVLWDDGDIWRRPPFNHSEPQTSSLSSQLKCALPGLLPLRVRSACPHSRTSLLVRRAEANEQLLWRIRAKLGQRTSDHIRDFFPSLCMDTRPAAFEGHWMYVTEGRTPTRYEFLIACIDDCNGYYMQVKVALRGDRICIVPQGIKFEFEYKTLRSFQFLALGSRMYSVTLSPDGTQLQGFAQVSCCRPEWWTAAFATPDPIRRCPFDQSADARYQTIRKEPGIKERIVTEMELKELVSVRLTQQICPQSVESIWPPLHKYAFATPRIFSKSNWSRKIEQTSQSEAVKSVRPTPHREGSASSSSGAAAPSFLTDIARQNIREAFAEFDSESHSESPSDPDAPHDVDKSLQAKPADDYIEPVVESTDIPLVDAVLRYQNFERKLLVYEVSVGSVKFYCQQSMTDTQVAMPGGRTGCPGRVPQLIRWDPYFEGPPSTLCAVLQRSGLNIQELVARKATPRARMLTDMTCEPGQFSNT